MIVKETKLKDVLEIIPKVHGDDRGFFKETFHIKRYGDIGIPTEFVQQNMSRSSKNTIRGLHFQKKYPQGKLVSCLRGSIFDVVVNINKNSPQFMEYIGIELSDSNHKQLWIPPGYAHGFQVLSDTADFYYLCTDIYHPEDEYGIMWNDKDININWPLYDPIVSNKDSKNLLIKDLF